MKKLVSKFAALLSFIGGLTGFFSAYYTYNRDSKSDLRACISTLGKYPDALRESSREASAQLAEWKSKPTTANQDKVFQAVVRSKMLIVAAISDLDSFDKVDDQLVQLNDLMAQSLEAIKSSNPTNAPYNEQATLRDKLFSREPLSRLCK